MGNSSQNRTNSLLDTQRRSSQSRYSRPQEDSQNRGDASYDDTQGRLRGLSDRYSNLADTGGFDPHSFDALRSTFGGGGGGGSSVANELSSTGGIDESKFSGALAGYDEFAHGGGLDIEGIRARSNSATPSFYKNLQNEMERRRLVNPYGPTFDAEGAAMARQAGQETQKNIRDTELDIGDRVSANKQFGIRGLGDLNTAIQGMKQQGKIAGGSQQISNAGLAESAAARRQSGETDILHMLQSGRLAGLGGLEGLFQTQNTNTQTYADRHQRGLEGQDQAQLGNIAARQNTTPWWKTILGAASGPAAAYFGARG